MYDPVIASFNAYQADQDRAEREWEETLPVCDICGAKIKSEQFYRFCFGVDVYCHQSCVERKLREIRDSGILDESYCDYILSKLDMDLERSIW